MSEIRISSEFLCALMKKGNAVECTQGLPEGAAFKGWYIDEATNSLCLEFVHSASEDVSVRFRNAKPKRGR